MISFLFLYKTLVSKITSAIIYEAIIERFSTFSTMKELIARAIINETHIAQYLLLTKHAKRSTISLLFTRLFVHLRTFDAAQTIGDRRN